MRFVKYRRHEFHNPKPEKREAALCAFIYDIPYLGSCGIFPPLHILNWILKRGGESGGMGPGASWEPFAIDQEEYNELLKTLATLDPKSLEETARYTSIKFNIDPAFDHIQDWKEWIQAVAEKHREDFHKEMRRVDDERK